MTSKLPDPATLDAMLLGVDGLQEDWENLVSAPGGAQAWEAAQQRRASLDRLAELTTKMPWLSSVLLLMRRAGRAFRQRPDMPEIVFSPMQAALQPLGPTEEPATGRIPLQWGDMLEKSLPIDTVFELDVPEDFEVFYHTASQRLPLPKRKWKVESQDEPTLLVVVSSGIDVAALLVVVAEKGETTGD
jgi:hypothetical protein